MDLIAIAQNTVKLISAGRFQHLSFSRWIHSPHHQNISGFKRFGINLARSTETETHDRNVSGQNSLKLFIKRRNRLEAKCDSQLIPQGLQGFKKLLCRGLIFRLSGFNTCRFKAKGLEVKAFIFFVVSTISEAFIMPHGMTPKPPALLIAATISGVVAPIIGAPIKGASIPNRAANRSAWFFNCSRIDIKIKTLNFYRKINSDILQILPVPYNCAMKANCRVNHYGKTCCCGLVRRRWLFGFGLLIKKTGVRCQMDFSWKTGKTMMTATRFSRQDFIDATSVADVIGALTLKPLISCQRIQRARFLRFSAWIFGRPNA